jgi:hypothetical protein
MPDRTPVGWLLPEARKKKMDVTIFLPSRAHLSTNNHKFSITHYTRLDCISSETMYNKDILQIDTDGCAVCSDCHE